MQKQIFRTAVFLVSFTLFLVSCGGKTVNNTAQEEQTAPPQTQQAETDFSGYWSWTENDDYKTFGIALQQTGNNITGTHIAVARGGMRIDDSDGTNSITGTVSNGIATVKITSGYSGETSEATIKSTGINTIEWTVTKPNGERYFPDKAMLKK